MPFHIRIELIGQRDERKENVFLKLLNQQTRDETRKVFLFPFIL